MDYNSKFMTVVTSQSGMRRERGDSEMKESLRSGVAVLRCDVQQWVQTTRYRRSVMIISSGWRMPSSAEPRGRTESTARDEQPVGRQTCV